MENSLIAYLAGSMDSDGFFSLHAGKDRNNEQRIDERIGLNQVTPQIPHLLEKAFGGSIGYYASSTPNARKMYRWSVSGAAASHASGVLYPYLTIKRRQAEILIEFNETRERRYKQFAYWFEQEYPNWQELEMVTTKEVANRLGYADLQGVGQAIHGGIILALPSKSRNTFVPRVPRLLIEQLESENSRRMPSQLRAWRQKLLNEITKLNKRGI